MPFVVEYESPLLVPKMIHNHDFCPNGNSIEEINQQPLAATRIKPERCAKACEDSRILALLILIINPNLPLSLLLLERS